MDEMRCERCGQFMDPQKAGASWAVIFDFYPPAIREELIRCSACTSKKGPVRTNARGNMSFIRRGATMTSLEEIKRLLAAATKLFPAPWARDEYINQIHCAEDRGAVVADMRGWGYLTGTLGLDPDDAVEAQKANAQLIAKAPTLIAELIEQVERANKAAFRIEEIWHSEWVEKLGPDATLSSAHQGELNALRRALEGSK